jgi:LuxR family transcriptional regulator, maltose regulon positive regulatory protein
MGNVFASLAASNALAQLQVLQGQLHQAAATYREVEQYLADVGVRDVLDTNPAYWFGRGDLLREQNDLEASREHLAHGMRITRGSITLSAIYVAQGYLALARLQAACGEHASAHATLVEFLDLAGQRGFIALLVNQGLALQAQLWLAQGELAAARRWADAGGLSPVDDLSYPRELEHLTLARVRIAQGRSDPAGAGLSDALRLLDRLLAAAEAGGRNDGVIKIEILRALALEAQGDRRRALGALERALELAIPQGYVRAFVEEGAPMAALLAHALAAQRWNQPEERRSWAIHTGAKRILDLLRREGVQLSDRPPPQTSARQPLASGGELLTERELEVLRLLARGRSNQAIAAELVVAVGTVKRHVHSIIGKLQAQSRLEAVAYARERGLV